MTVDSLLGIIFGSYENLVVLVVFSFAHLKKKTSIE